MERYGSACAIYFRLLKITDCINSRGEVVYWSHNGSTDERWPSVAVWHQQVCVDRQ